MTRFRPYIDLHDGKVKQIVGGTLRDEGDGPVENFVAEQDASWYANLYRQDTLHGGHVIKLGPGNDVAAKQALKTYPGGLQVGGGINATNAVEWLEVGASHVIVTSWLFDDQARLVPERLDELVSLVGRERIVLDLSCRRTEVGWQVAMNRWQTLTDVSINPSTLDDLAKYADEFLVHAADVEGLCKGVDLELIELLSRWDGLKVTYAGGVGSFTDVETVAEVSNGKLDITVGSALDIFGGTDVKYRDLIQWNRRNEI